MATPVDPTKATSSMPWLQIGSIVGGGLLNALGQSSQRMAQRNAIGQAIKAEQDYRSDLRDERSKSTALDQGNLNTMMSKIALDNTPQSTAVYGQMFNQLSQGGMQRRSGIDQSMAESKKVEQQLLASKPKKYDMWDATTDFITGGLGAGQAAQGFIDQSTAREGRQQLMERENKAFDLDYETNQKMLQFLNNKFTSLQPVGPGNQWNIDNRGAGRWLRNDQQGGGY